MLRSRLRGSFFLLLLVPFFLLLPTPNCMGIEPSEILVVYNSNLPQSAQLAAYYQRKRGLPRSNLYGLPLPDKEFIARPDFERLLVTPLRNRLAKQNGKERISTLLLMYGVPLKVGPARPPGKSWTDTLSNQRQAIASQMISLLDRLGTILGLPPADLGRFPSVATLRKRWKEVDKQLPVWHRKHGNDQDFNARNAEVETLLIRLNGLAPVARNILRRAPKDLRPEALDKLVFVDSLINQQLTLFLFSGVTRDNLLSALSLQQVDKGLLGAYSFLTIQQQQPPTHESSAAVDSELCLLRRPSFRTGGWLANPFLQRYDHFPGIEQLRRQTLMVCRLDGPSPAIVRRMIDDSVYAERHGLTGNFYIDGRGLADSKKKNDPYVEYDRHLEKLYNEIKDKSPLPVVYDNTPALFPAHAKLPAALYVGWYSLGRYVDAFAWQRGSVGFHVASAEASTLRDKTSTVWCKRMLEEGIAATLGPTQEPYLQSFPLPDRFFPLLMKGKLPLIKVYYRTLPFLSWRQVLIGDPLYRPFAKRPRPLRKNKRILKTSGWPGSRLHRAK